MDFETLMHEKNYSYPDTECERPLKIGVVGYSDSSKIKEESIVVQSTIIGALHQIEELLKQKHGDCEQFEIVSGLTDMGIPGLVYHYVTGGTSLRKKYAKTIGIACSKAKDYPNFPVDEKHIIGNEWGDESDFFLNYIDGLIRIGGGEQSLNEVKTFKLKFPVKPCLEFEV